MTSTLILPSLILLVGLALLVWSSDIFIEGAASTAKHLDVSPLIIGVLVLGFGTSMPEIIVSILASMDGTPGLAVGNVIGSNIANIALVLGVTAIIAPIVVKSSLLKKEFPVLIAVTLLVYFLVLDEYLGKLDGIILIVLLIITMYWMVQTNRQAALDPEDPIAEEAAHELEEMTHLSKKKALVFLVAGLVVLMVSAKMMVWGAVEIAEYFEVPEVIIGLTIVAIGTSLPELAAAISAARKNEADLMIGNIIGSNLFNLLAVLAMPALIAPSVLGSEVVYTDFLIMFILTIFMLVFALPRKGAAQIGRGKGAIFAAAFVAYMVLLYFRATQ